jgi:hypothetical protein
MSSVGQSHEREAHGVHIQVVDFELNDIDEQQYRQECDQFAPLFAAIPGLISKVWLVDRSTNTYGGVYTGATGTPCKTISMASSSGQFASTRISGI